MIINTKVSVAPTVGYPTIIYERYSLVCRV
nr:MAG TPA: hypothetical protein [Bacteriophage sp.]